MAGTITAAARAQIVYALLQESIITNTKPWLGVGIGPGTSSATDVALFEESGNRSPGISINQVTTVTSGDTYQWVGAYTSNATQTLTNLGLFQDQGTPIQGQLAQQVTSNTQNYIKPTNYFNWSTNYPYQVQVSSEVMTVYSGNNFDTLYVYRGQNNSTALMTIPAGTWITQSDTSMFVKTDFTGLSLSAGDLIQFTIKIQFQ
jgi:hypothetical protein